MPTKHLPYGGSTIARTLQCPAWLNLSSTLPESDASSSYADEGTLLHNCMEAYVKTGEDIMSMVTRGVQYKDQVLTQELADEKLYPAANALALAGVRPPGDFRLDSVIVEPFVELIPGMAGGSIDVLSVSADGKTLLVLDYKFGHQQVPAKDNKQLLFYALCALVDESHQLDLSHVDTLQLVIVQPQDGECTPDIWTVSESVLDDFEDTVYEALNRSEANPADGSNAVAGDHCRFCPAEALCPSKTGLAARALRLTPEHADELAAAMAMAPQLENWVKAVRKLAHEQAELGVHIHGYKLVNKRARRVWTDTNVAAHKIKKMRGVSIREAQNHELKSPPQIEKLFKAKGVDFTRLGDYISSVSSGTTLVPESDKREESLPVGALKLTLDSLT